MIEWRDRGLVLAARPHGETAVILELLTASKGRHLGLVHGGRSRRRTPVLQPGNAVDATWRARVESQLGTYTVEPLRTRAGDVLADPLRLAALAALCALAAFVLPERDPVPAFHARTEDLADALADGAGWLRDYVAWEVALLAEAGVGLDLTACAAGGPPNELAYVSPRTGRAVSRSGAGAWADRLLPLPPILLGGAATAEGALAALDLTGHFLSRLAPSLGDRPLPPARARLIDALRRAAV